MRSLNGGYIMIDLADANAYAYAKSTVGVDKPILIYDTTGNPYYADKVSKVGTDLVITTNKGVIVLSADGTIISSRNITDITKISSSILEGLECGDIILKDTEGQKHAYIVSYKQAETGICLTYTDATTVETVSYDYTDGAWVYNSTDKTTLTPDA